MIFSKSLARFSIFTLAILPASLLAQEKEENLLDGNPVHGRELFVSKSCIECHSVRGAGGSVGPDLGLKVFNRSVYEISGILWNHSPYMSRKMRQMGVRRPQFEPSEMLDLVSFLYFLNYFDPPGDVQLGRQLWVEKKCSSCHPVEGEGPKLAPGLDKMQSPTTSVFLAQSMWNHGSQMLETLRRMNLDPPAFRGTEMVDLVAYIRHINRNPSRQLFSLGEPRQGERLFRINGCASCHAAQGAARASAPDLRAARLQASVSQIAGLMWNHLPNMLSRMRQQQMRFPTFSGQDMNHLISYLYSLAYVGKPGDPQKGATVYREKQCLSCHGEPGKPGQRIGPDLAKATLQSPLGAAPFMWNHAVEMEGYMKERNILWPRFEGTQMADLQAYLKASAAKSK
ncbi:MAG: c-type cytochrome [Acidobacteria bacterium]|nr:c-type cytochrome [Acidobacteriota bacterium]